MRIGGRIRSNPFENRCLYPILGLYRFQMIELRDVFNSENEVGTVQPQLILRCDLQQQEGVAIDLTIYSDSLSQGYGSIIFYIRGSLMKKAVI